MIDKLTVYYGLAIRRNCDSVEKIYNAIWATYYHYCYVAVAIFPVFTDLSSKNLLERCVGGFNQNNNESYNQLIWKISPKIVPAGSKTVEIAAYIAAGTFNEGMASLLYYMQAMGITLGPNAYSYAEKEDEKRVNISNIRARENTRDGIMARRQHLLELLEAAEASEGLLYGPGIDDSM